MTGRGISKVQALPRGQEARFVGDDATAIGDLGIKMLNVAVVGDVVDTHEGWEVRHDDAGTDALTIVKSGQIVRQGQRQMRFADAEGWGNRLQDIQHRAKDPVVEIYQCGNSLCGAISGMVLAPADKTPVDWQGQSQCGLVIVRTAADPVPGNKPAWFGSITNPRNGSVYHARLTLDADGNLLLRGYVGLPVFGATQTWTRDEGDNPPADCRLSTTATQTAASGAAASNG